MAGLGFGRRNLEADKVNFRRHKELICLHVVPFL